LAPGDTFSSFTPTTKKNSHGGSLRQALPKALSPTCNTATGKRKTAAATRRLLLWRLPVAHACLRLLVSRQSFFISQQSWFFAVAAALSGWRSPKGSGSQVVRPLLRSGGWGVALWRAAAGLLPSRVRFLPQLVVGFTRSLSLSPRPALAGSLPPGFRRSAFHSFIMPRLHGNVNRLPRKHGIKSGVRFFLRLVLGDF
jgi:hypothetical protein